MLALGMQRIADAARPMPPAEALAALAGLPVADDRQRT